MGFLGLKGFTEFMGVDRAYGAYGFFMGFLSFMGFLV